MINFNSHPPTKNSPEAKDPLDKEPIDRMGGGRRDAKRAERLAAILAAAERVFAETGFAGATTGAIAKAAELPKPTLHYYFTTKEDLYRAVISRILDLWLGVGDGITSEADPVVALTAYVEAKLHASRTDPYASKVFANELLHGAPHIGDYLKTSVRHWLQVKTQVFADWAARGAITPVATDHYFFALWAATQTYADFSEQITAVLGGDGLSPAEWEKARTTLVRMALAPLGL